MSKPPRPVLRPLIIPPATTSANIRNVTAVHKPIQMPITVAPEKDSNNSNHHNIPKTPVIIDSIPLTPLPTYSIANTNRSKKETRRYPNTAYPHTSGRPWEDLEHQAAARNILGVDGKKKKKGFWARRQDSKADIIALCVGAVLGIVGLTVYFIVIRAKGEIDT